MHVQEVLRDGARVVFIIAFAHRRWFTFVAIHACTKMPTVITNIATCIAQVTLKLVHYALLINQLLFVSLSWRSWPIFFLTNTKC